MTAGLCSKCDHGMHLHAPLNTEATYFICGFFDRAQRRQCDCRLNHLLQERQTGTASDTVTGTEPVLDEVDTAAEWSDWNAEQNRAEALARAYDDERNYDPTERTEVLLERCLGALGLTLAPNRGGELRVAVEALEREARQATAVTDAPSANFHTGREYAFREVLRLIDADSR